jgi:lactate dehydrogenase-like 2-hydroxyacid dehydrogenase
MDRVFVTREIPSAGLNLLADRAEVIVSPFDRELTPQEIVERTADCKILVCTPANKIGAFLFNKRPQIRLVASFGAGVDHIDLEAANEYDVIVTNTPGVLSATTANMAMALILALTRRLLEGDQLLRAGGFKGVHPLFMLGTDLAGKVLGIYGLGQIGLSLARRATAFGMEILYHNRNKRLEVESELRAQWVGFDELLEKGDIISINAPLTDQTRGIFNYQAFSRMKPDAFFINTARGSIHNEADLVKALDEKLIAGAGLDVYEHEPQVHSGLLKMKNVVLAPHLGTATDEVRTKMSLLAAENVISFLDGRRPPNRVE